MAKRDIITSVAQVTSRKHCRWILLLLEYIVRITFYIPFKLIITWEQLDTTFPRYVIYWGSRSWNLVAWFARDSCVQPPRLVRRPSKHAGANQIATRLLVHCSGPARCCSQPASQPAGCYRPTACGRTDRPKVTAAKVWAAYMHAFLEKCLYFRNDDPYRHKNPAHVSCTWSVRVCVPNFAVVRRGV